MKIKKTLKKIKSSESTISTFMGVFVVLVVGFLMVKYFQGSSRIKETKPNITGQTVLEESKPTEGTKETVSPSLEPLGNLSTKHTIAKGDSLWKIAEKYYGSGYNWVDIAKENQVLNPDKIEEGMILNIPSVKVRIVTSRPSNTKVPLSPITENKYQIVKGDNLWNICLRAYGDGYRWTEIVKVNGIKNPDIIYSGTTLTLPR